MAKMKSTTYTIVHANGEIEQIKVPTLFSCYQVAERLPHSLVYMHVPRSHRVSTRSLTGSGVVIAEGGSVCMIYGAELYKMPNVPTTDGEALHHWKLIPKKEGAA